MKCPKCNQEVQAGWCDCEAAASANTPTSRLDSYGSGERAQVFEVIVRQGMASAPWREICAGAMQVNNISPEEIQAEIDKRQGGGSGPFYPPVPKKPLDPKGSGGASLSEPKSAMKQLQVCLELVGTMIKEKKSSGDFLQDELERIRTELNTLSDLMIDEEISRNMADAEARLQQDLERENNRIVREIKPPD